MTSAAATLLRIALTVTLAAGATSSAAQSDDDWDFFTDTSQNLTAASVEYSSGTVFVALCRSGSLELAITGLPQSAPGTAPYAVDLSGNRTETVFWTRRGDGTTLSTNGSGRLLRSLKPGGRLTIASKPGASVPVRIQLDLPSSSNVVDTVLTTCGYPTTNARDALPSVEDFLISWPRADMPDLVIERRAAPTFEVWINCLVADARLTACVSEHQAPAHPRDGQIVASSINGMALQLTDSAAAEGRVWDFVLTGSRTRIRP